MTKIKLFTYCLASLLLFSFTLKKTHDSFSKKGFIYKVVLNVDENLMERALVKNPDNSIHLFPITKKRSIVGYKTYFINEIDEKTLERSNLDTPNNGPVYEMISEKGTATLLTDLGSIIASNAEVETVDFFKKSKSGKVFSMMGNMASNALGKNKLSFSLPNKKLKKIKEKADEYYEIKMDFVYGGASDYRIVMNKQKGEPSLKFKIKSIITASDKKGNVLWKKEKELTDFSSIFKPEDILQDKKGKYFKVKRLPRKFNSWNKEPIGGYLSLTTREFEECIKFSLTETLKTL